MNSKVDLSGATARPWQQRIGYTHGEPVSQVIYSGADPIGEVTGITVEDEANAALIVQAVNSFEAMREALEMVQKLFVAPSGRKDMQMVSCRGYVQRALKLAEGGGRE